MLPEFVTCSDCGEFWLESCYVCKKRKWNNTSKEDRKISHEYVVKNRNFWSKRHPRRVVTLIILGHDPACKCCCSVENLTFDHVIPLSKGGLNCHKTNGQILCQECNVVKGDRIIDIEDLRLELDIKTE